MEFFAPFVEGNDISSLIPTTLSERTFEQLLEFFRDNKLDRKKIFAFFSITQFSR